MNKLDQIVVISPTYNEAKNIEQFISSIIKNNLNLLVIDDNSPDGTADLIKNSKLFNKKVFLIERPMKLGLGSAYRDGFTWFLNSNFTHCIEMDVDFSHTINDLKKILNVIFEFDMVIGSRYIDGGGSKGWDIKRKLLSKYANKFAKYLLKSKTNDLTSGFRSFSRKSISAVNFSKTKTNGYGFQIEIIHNAELNGLNIKEIPIIFEERRLGKSKMNYKISIEAFFLILKLFFIRLKRS